MHPMSDPGETPTDSQDQTIAALRHITVEQLRNLGARQVVYLKAGTRNGEQAFGVFGADGTPLAVVDDVETAMVMVPNTASILSAYIEWKRLPCR
jgi:hypothetical protein